MRSRRIKVFIVGVALIFAPQLSVAQQQQEITTQVEMENEACGAAKMADAELNRIYTKILTHYESDKNFIDKMKEAQRVWVIYRDSHIASVYPAENKNLYGSVYGMCYCGLREQMVVERIKLLRLWLDGVMDGEVCVGSLDPERPQ